MATTAGAPQSRVTPCSSTRRRMSAPSTLRSTTCGHAHGGQGVGHPPAVAVEHRQGVQVGVAVADAGVPPEDRRVGPEVAVRHLDALGARRRAGRVVDGGGGVLVLARPTARARRPRGRPRRRCRCPARTRCFTSRWATESASSGSTSSIDAPECSRMYSISAGDRRKLIGTSTRPKPLTPKNEVSSRPLFCESTATRSPRPMPRSSRSAAWARASSCAPAVGDGAEPAARRVGLVDGSRSGRRRRGRPGRGGRRWSGECAWPRTVPA